MPELTRSSIKARRGVSLFFNGRGRPSRVRAPYVDGAERHHRGVAATNAAATPLTNRADQRARIRGASVGKKYKDDAEERQNQAASAAFARATGAQKDMMIKILSKLTGNMSMLSFKVWKRKSDEFTQQYNLLKKIMTRMMKIKIYTSFRHWHNVVFLSGLSKVKMREALLESQRENLSSTLAERAEELRKLQQEATDLLALSQQNAQRTAEVMQCSDHFADALHLILDPKALEKRNALSYEDMERMMAEGADPAQFQKPPYDPVPPPNPTRATARREAEAPGGIGGGLGFLDTPAGGRAAPARTGAARGQICGGDLDGKPRPPGYRHTDPPRGLRERPPPRPLTPLQLGRNGSSVSRRARMGGALARMGEREFALGLFF